jgi:hypothetical protein
VSRREQALRLLMPFLFQPGLRASGASAAYW